MEEDQDTVGGRAMAGHTMACSRDAKETMELETVSNIQLLCIQNASQALHLLAAVFVGLLLQIVQLLA
jgi:hypothetical protein